MLFSAACALASIPLWLALLFSGNVWVLLAALVLWRGSRALESQT